MPEQNRNLVQVPLSQLNEYLQKGYRPAPLQRYEPENIMEQPVEDEMGLMGSVGRGLAASGLDVVGAAANWSRAAAQITKLQPLEDIGFSVDKYADDLIARKFSLPPDVKDLDPGDPRWWGYNIARMAPQLGVQYGIMAGLAAFGVPAPIGMALGAGFGGFMEGAGAIEESLAKGDRGTDPIVKGLEMGAAAVFTNWISMGNVGKVGGTGLFGKLLRMSVSGGWEMGTEAIEEPINDLIVYGRLQPNMLKRMAIVGLPSFVLGSGTHVISRLGQAEPTTKPPDESEGFTATGTGGVPVYSTGEPIVPPSTPDVEPEGEIGRVIPPWMLTSSEYVEEIDPSIPPAIRQPNGRMAPNPAYQAAKANRLRKLVEHAKHVRDAVDRGEVVPPSILREYATGKNARDWAIAAYRKAVGTEPTGTQPTQAAQPVAPGEVESKDINVSVTPEGDLAIDHIEAIEAAELPLPPESVASQFTTKEQELIIGNELLQKQPELTPEEFDSIVDDLIAAGELSSDTLKAAEWLEIAKYVRTMTGVRGNAKPGDIAVNAVRRARRDFAMPSISYMDAMKLKSLIEQVTGWSTTIGDFLRQVGSREGQLNIRAPHFIPGVNKVFTPTQEAQLIHFFGRRLTTDHQRATFVRLLERLVWNAMHSIGFNPIEYFKNSFLGFHNEISSTEFDSPLGLAHGFSGPGIAILEHAGTMPVYQGENDIIDISKRLEPGPRPSTDTSMEGSPVVIPNPSDPISTSIGIKGSAPSHTAFHEFGHMFDVLTGVAANVPEVADSPLYAALERLYGAPFRQAYHGNLLRSANDLEDFAEFIEAFVWNDEGVLQRTGNREIDDAIKDFRAFQDVQKDIYKETPSNPALGAVPVSPFMRAVMQALFTGSSMTVFYRTDIPRLEPGSTFGTERRYKGSRHTAMDSPLDVLTYLKGQTEFLERLSSKKSLAMLRKNVKRALSIGLQKRLSELPQGVKATEQEVMDAILKYADGVATILDSLTTHIKDLRFFLNNATVYTAEERNSYLKELESYSEIARKFSTSFTEALASEYNKLAKTNNAPDFYKTREATDVQKFRRLLTPDKSSGSTEVEPLQSEFLTPSERELRRKDRLVKTFAKKAITRAQLNDPKFVAERDAKIEEYIRAGFLDEETLITAKIKLIVEDMEGYLSTSTSIPIRDVLTELMKQLVFHKQTPATSIDMHLGPDPLTEEAVTLRSPLARLTFEDATILHRLLRDKFAKPGTREWQFNYFLEQIGELNKASQPPITNTYRLAIDIKMPAAPNYSLPKPDYVLPFGVRKQLEYLLNRSIVHSKEAIDACIRTIDRFYHNTLSSSNVKNPRAFLHKHFHGFWRSPGYIPKQDADAASAPTITGYALPQEPQADTANMFGFTLFSTTGAFMSPMAHPVPLGLSPNLGDSHVGETTPKFMGSEISTGITSLSGTSNVIAETGAEYSEELLLDESIDPYEPHSNALSPHKAKHRYKLAQSYHPWFDPSFDAFIGVVVKDVSFSTLIHEVTHHIQFVADGMPGSQLSEALRRIYKVGITFRTDIQHEDMPYLMEALILNGTFLQLNGPNLDPILQQDLRLIRDELLAYFNIAKVAVTPTAQATFLMNALLGGDSIIPLVYDLDFASDANFTDSLVTIDEMNEVNSVTLKERLLTSTVQENIHNIIDNLSIARENFVRWMNFAIDQYNIFNQLIKNASEALAVDAYEDYMRLTTSMTLQFDMFREQLNRLNEYNNDPMKGNGFLTKEISILEEFIRDSREEFMKLPVATHQTYKQLEQKHAHQPPIKHIQEEDIDVGVLPLESRKSAPDPDLTGSYELDPDLALLASLISDQDIANVDFDARLGDTATAGELIRSYRERPPHHIVDKSGKPFNLRTVAGQKGFLASLHTPGHWDEWESSGRELARALVSEGNPVDIIADWISKGRAMNTRIMSALHHIHLLVNYTLPPVDLIEDEIIRQNLAIPGRAMFIEELVKRTKSESGRMLNEGNRQVQLEGAVKVLDGLIAMEKLLPRIKPNSKVYLEFREKLVRSEEPLETLNEFLQLYEKSKVAHNVIMSLFYNSLLSNPSTHIANTTFNGVWGLSLSPHRAIVGMVDSVWSAVTGRPRTVFAGEGLSLLRGYAAHFRDPEWNRAFKTMWRREGMIDSITKTEEEMGLVYRDELRKDAITAFLEGKGSVAEFLGKTLTTPSRALIAMDAWAKAIAERGQEEALRYRFSKYTGEQLTRAKIDFIKTSLAHLRLSDNMLRRYNIRHTRHLNAILEDEVDIGNRLDNLFEAAIRNEMARFAEHATFQDEPGAMTRALLSLRSRSGPLGRMLVPFLQTIMNITKRGLELTPGVGIPMGIHQSLSPQEIMAKQIESLILTAIVYSLIQAGKITGPPPEDPGEREVFYAAGMQPWAVRIGNKYYSYRNIEPFGLPMSILTEQYGKWVKQEDERLSLDTFLSSFITVRDHLVGNTFLRTVDAMLGNEWDLKNQLWWTTASFVPFSGFWRGMKRQYEDWAYDKVAIRDNTFLSVFGDSLPPGLAGMVQGEPKLSAMGEPIYRENAGLRFLPREWLPIRATEYKPDRVEQLFMDVGYYPRYPGQNIKLVDKGPYVTIPDDLYKDYIIAVGQKGKRELDRLASRPYFNSIPTKRKTDLVISTWNKVRDREREKVKVMLRRQRITSKRN